MSLLRSVFSLMVLLAAAPIGQAQDFVGDAVCSGCHANMPRPGFFRDYQQTGHPYKLVKVERGQAPEWPHTDPPPLPTVGGEQLTWDDITYVIGNFYWKARFVGRDGYIITGGADDRTQWNLQTQEWVPYNPGRVTPYNCGGCHTTGYSAEGHQDDLEGIVGTWSEPGVRCEACHGPGSAHAANPRRTSPPGGKTCAECHFRDAAFRMPWKSGFMQHHQQAEELAHSPHADFRCTRCHDPHKSTLYELGGLKASADCRNCHEGAYAVDRHEALECIDCHMPFIGKSAVATNPYRGDVRGHLFLIKTDPVSAAANVDTIEGATYWRQEQDGRAKVTLDYACMGCHTDGDLQTLSQWAQAIHNRHPSTVDAQAQAPFRTELTEARPNPFNSTTRLGFGLSRPGAVKVVLLDASGRQVRTLAEGVQPAGAREVTLDGRSLPAGPYWVRLEAEGLQLHRRVVLVK